MAENNVEFLNYLAWVVFANRDPKDVPTDPVKRRQVALECFMQIPMAMSVTPVLSCVSTTTTKQKFTALHSTKRQRWQMPKRICRSIVNADLVEKIIALPLDKLAQHADTTVGAAKNIVGRITHLLVECSYVVPVKDLKSYIVDTSMVPLSDCLSSRMIRAKSKTCIILDYIAQVLQE